jgi:ADP-ribose pyrophosphatase YjhB (NUDIX family)
MDERQLLEAKALVNIVFPVSGDQVILAKKKDKIGVGLWNGYGGAVDLGETMEESAIREFTSESKVQATLEDLEILGSVVFFNHLEEGEVKLVRCQVFRIKKWQGELKETEEMGKPQSFPINQLPTKDMMLADQYWVPQFLLGQANYAEVHYGNKRTKLLEPVILKKLP